MPDTTEESKVSALESLLNEDTVQIPAVGDVVSGVVIHVSSNHALVDLGPLGTGVVLGKEMKSGLGGGSSSAKATK
jgi:ribosomal protein S1